MYSTIAQVKTCGPILYTGVTRAKEMMILVGESEGYQSTAMNNNMMSAVLYSGRG